MSYDALFTPLRIGGVTIKNRIILCAMGGTNPLGFDGRFEPAKRDYYLARAKANVGLMIPGVIGLGSRGNWLYEKEDLFLGPVKELMDELHAYGSKFFLQLGAGFGRSMMVFTGMELPEAALKQTMVAPSDGLPNVWKPEVKHRGLTVEEIHEIVEAYGKTAALCKRAGIDGVEIHAVHEGYLLDQFAMANMNHRTDEYGGSLENRLRFACECIRSIKAACGEDYPVSVRYSVASKIRGFNQGALPGENYVEFGRSLEESPAAARLLEAAGADLLNADNGSYDSWYWAHPPVYMPMSCNLPEVSYLKNFVHIPVACAGRMHDPAVAAKAVAEGAIDAVGVARQLLCDPDWCDEIREGREEDVRPCIACHNGCFAVSHYKGNSCTFASMGECALNPQTFHEKERAIVPAEAPKRVAVIGGGIAGMEAARVLRLRGHAVTLYEKSGELGGVFIAAAAPAFKEQDKKLLRWYERQMEKLGVDVRLNSPVDSLDALEADAVLVATGAEARKLPIPGFDGPNAVEAIDYLRGRKAVGERVAVIGGGLTGCEIAYDLALKGKKPVIVEMQDDILKLRGLSAANSNMLRELIRYYNIGVRLETALKEITPAGVRLAGPEGESFLEADSVILSVGYVPVNPFPADPRVTVIGDAAGVGNLMTVIRAAFDAALAI